MRRRVGGTIHKPHVGITLMPTSRRLSQQIDPENLERACLLEETYEKYSCAGQTNSEEKLWRTNKI